MLNTCTSAIILQITARWDGDVGVDHLDSNPNPPTLTPRGLRGAPAADRLDPPPLLPSSPPPVAADLPHPRHRKGLGPSSSMAAGHLREVWSGVGSRDDRSGGRRRLSSESWCPVSDGFDKVYGFENVEAWLWKTS
jgi:hypothetical protein